MENTERIPENLVSTLTATEISYIAGFVDGEGCLNIIISSRRRLEKMGTFAMCFCAALTIVNTNFEIINWLKNKIGGTCVKHKVYNIHHKPCYHLKITSKPILLGLLEKIYPYLIVKKEQAKVVIDLLKTRDLVHNKIGEKEYLAKAILNKLNKRGC